MRGGVRKDRRIYNSTRAWRGDGGMILSLMVSMHFSTVVVTLNYPSPSTVHCDCDGNNTGDDCRINFGKLAPFRTMLK